MPFDDNERFLAIYRSGFHHHGVTDISIETCGDAEGVRISDIEALEHTYEVLKYPTIKIGDTSNKTTPRAQLTCIFSGETIKSEY